MEDNKKNKSKSSIIIILGIILLFCAGFTALCATGNMPIPKGTGGFTDLQTAALVKESYKVEDEKTLRELLYLKDTLDIVVTKDIYIEEPLIVRGNKTLYGDAKIYTDIAGKFETMYLMEIQVGASLTMDGLVLDGGGMADGINVGQKASLTYLSGTIQYMRNGIYSNGTVTMKGGLIQHMAQNGVISSFRGKAYINGGTYFNSGSHLLNVEINGYMEINDGALIRVCVGDAVFNAGELCVYGGEFCDTLARAINTDGKLTMEYKGNKKDGYIEMHDIGSIAVRMNASYDCLISDVHAVNLGTNAVFTTDLRSNGKTTIKDCVFENTCNTEGFMMSVSRKIVIKNVVGLNSQGGGVNLRTYSDAKIDGLTIDGTKANCIQSFGKLEATNLNFQNVGVNNLCLQAESEATVTDSVFGVSKRTNVFLTKNTTLNLENVQVEGVLDDGIFGFQCNAGSTLNLKGDKNVIKGATRVGVCLYKGATLNMEGGKICDIKGTANGAAVWVREEGATFNMHGGTITNCTTTGSSGAVFVSNKATFNMYGGTITGNSAKLSGGAIQVQGVMNLKGGTISNNKCGTTGGGINVGNNAKSEIYGTLNMTGGTITGNHADTNGGGISVSGKTTANISGGTIKNNTADKIGNGIADNGKLTINPNAYITGNDVGIVDRSIIVRIAGNKLNKHSESDPLYVTPHFKTKPNDYVVIEFDNESVAAAMLNKIVKSGTSVYTLLQKASEKQKIIVNVSATKLALDTTGAETVYVTEFQKLKEAVETTTTKRNIVVGADIVMESLITVPAGTVVRITDDGRTRTLTRNEKHTTLFFETWYGTGLVLEGTSEGKLVLDGKTSGDANLKNLSALVKVRGTSQFTNVAFQNNGNVNASLSGSFITNEYGYATIDRCSFVNGIGANGGAIYSTAQEMIIKDSVFENNTGKTRGGAIYNAGTATVIENTTFKNNTGAGSGGAIHNAVSGKLTLKGTSDKAVFENNTVTSSLAKDNYGGGALCVGTGTLTIDGYTFKNNQVVGGKGGAIELNSVNTVASITGATFITNKTTVANASDTVFRDGGAIWSMSKLTVEDSTFTQNTAAGQAGAIMSSGGKLDVINSAFKENTAQVNGGAIYGGSSATVTIKGSKNTAVFENNKAEGNTTVTGEIRGGGAIGIGSGTFTVDGYTFRSNESINCNGGAIQSNSTVGNSTITNCIFDANSTDKNGGAVATRSITTVKDSSFENNTASGQGGAFYASEKTTTITDSDFSGNGSTGNGGAMYGAMSCTVTLTSSNGASFTGNTSAANGGAICVGTGVWNVTGYTFEKNTAKQGGAVNLNNDNITATFTDATFTENDATGSGGAIASSATLIVDNSTFASNTSGNQGGAVYASTKTATIKDSDFSQNRSTAQGGAMYGASNCKVTLTSTKDNSFTGNTSATNGGAICVGTGAWTVTGYTFDGNSAAQGGAVNLNNANITASFTGCKFVSHQISGNGGAFYIDSSNTTEGAVTLTDCVIGESDKGNSAAVGGAIYNNKTNIIITGSTIEGNTATASGAAALGGAIYNNSNTITVKDTTFKANNAYQGAAAYVKGGALNVDKGTFEKNVAVNQGGALYITKDTGSANIQNSEFTGNSTTGYSGGAIWNQGTLVLVKTNFIENKSGTGGAAINCEGSSVVDVELKVDSCNFVSNTANGNGGAIAMASGTIAEFTGTGLFASNKAGAGTGGAIHANNAKINLSGYTFDRNTSTSTGGAINIGNGQQYKEADVNKIENATFTNNEANGNGGAIICHGYALTVIDSSFSGNTSTAQGGAIYTGTSCIVTLTSSKEASFTKNISTGATNGGGAIGVGSGTLSVTGYTFDGNTANNGGAIQFNNAAITANIKDSKFVNNTTAGYGGAIYNLSTSTAENAITITNCAFGEAEKGNTASSHGGAIYNNVSIVAIKGSTFTENTASNGNGGAIYSKSTVAAPAYGLTVENSIFTGNQIEGKTTSSYGGAIYATASRVKIVDTYFSGNKGYNGGAIGAHGGTIDIVGTDTQKAIFEGNSTTGSQGGAIRSMSSTMLTVTGYTFRGNIATGNGGAIEYEGKDGALTATNCKFDSNTSSGNGGAIHVADNGTVNLIGEAGNEMSTFIGNSANNGGAVSTGGSGTLNISDYTFTGNTAAGNGNAVYIGSKGNIGGCTFNADPNQTIAGSYTTTKENTFKY